MAKKIYVGNLPFTTTEQEVRAIFEAYGAIDTIKLIKNYDTGQFRGFGFVEMSDNEGQTAIDQLNGKDFNGRPLRVNEAKERQNNSRPRSY